MKNNKAGFTLIEMIFCISVILVILLLVICFHRMFLLFFDIGCLFGIFSLIAFALFNDNRVLQLYAKVFFRQYGFRKNGLRFLQ